jgi:hypothetical protein
MQGYQKDQKLSEKEQPLDTGEQQAVDKTM